MKPSLVRFSFFFLFFTVVFGFALTSFAVDAAPFWLRDGVYAYYQFRALIVVLQNLTQIWNAKGTYGWKCFGIAGDTATLEVMINVSGSMEIFTGEKVIMKDWAVDEKYEVDINVETREAYEGDEYVGILPYWMPTDVEKGQSITNFMSYGNLTLSVRRWGSCRQGIETPYKTFAPDEIWYLSMETVPLGEMSVVGNYFFFEKESGLLLKGDFIDSIWYEKASAESLVGYEDEWEFNLKEADIEFRPEPPSLLGLLLPYVLAAAAATAILSIALVYIVKARKKPAKTPTTSPNLHPAIQPLPRPHTALESPT